MERGVVNTRFKAVLEVLLDTNEIKHDMFVVREILPATCFIPQKGHLRARHYENMREGRQY
jgi:hypothetical protein